MSTDTTHAPPAPTGSLSLPSGGWAQLRDYDDLRSRHRKQVLAKFPTDGDFGPANVLTLLRELMRVMVLAWHLPYEPGAPLPSDAPDVLDDLSVRDENALTAALRPVLDLLNPDAVDPADHEDPDSPTGPSGA